MNTDGQFSLPNCDYAKVLEAIELFSLLLCLQLGYNMTSNTGMPLNEIGVVFIAFGRQLTHKETCKKTLFRFQS